MKFFYGLMVFVAISAALVAFLYNKKGLSWLFIATAIIFGINFLIEHTGILI